MSKIQDFHKTLSIIQDELASLNHKFENNYITKSEKHLKCKKYFQKKLTPFLTTQ